MDEFARYWDLASPEQKKALAAAVGTGKSYLSQVRHGHATPSPWLLKAIVSEINSQTKET